jgi:hypothetical protein
MVALREVDTWELRNELAGTVWVPVDPLRHGNHVYGRIQFTRDEVEAAVNCNDMIATYGGSPDRIELGRASYTVVGCGATSPETGANHFRSGDVRFIGDTMIIGGSTKDYIYRKVTCDVAVEECITNAKPYTPKSTWVNAS